MEDTCCDKCCIFYKYSRIKNTVSTPHARCCATNFWQHKTRYGRIQPETTRYGNIKLNTEEYNKIPLVFLLYCHVALTVVGCDYH